MTNFVADTVQVNLTLDTSDFKAGMVTIENIATKSSAIAAKKFNAGFLGNLKTAKIGDQLSNYGDSHRVKSLTNTLNQELSFCADPS